VSPYIIPILFNDPSAAARGNEIFRVGANLRVHPYCEIIFEEEIMKKLLLLLVGSSKRIMIVAAIIITLITTSFVFMKEEWFLSVSIKSSVNAHIQIFYDIGNDFNENDSVILPIAQTKDFLTLSFRLPNKSIQHLRIDPLNRDGHFVLMNLKIVNSFKIISPIALENVKSAQQIEQISIQDNMFIAVAGGDDPILLLDLEYPLVNRNILKIGGYAFVSLLGIFLVCYIVLHLGIKLFVKIKPSMPSVFLSKNTFINLAMLVISTGVSIVIGYIVYLYIMQPSETVVYQGQSNDYALSFYNGNGQKISNPDGTLKLKLDPFTIYANYPNQTSASYSINSDGFRDTYTTNLAPKKLAIVLGGSAAFGQGLSRDNYTFASHLSRLNQKYQVMNAATVGFLSGQELAQMIHVLDRFAPSVYILFDGWNDIFVPYSYAQSWPTNGGPIGFNNTFFMIGRQLAVVVENEQHSKVLPIANKIFEDEPEYFQAILSTYISNIDKMNAFANARKANFLVIFQPELGNKKLLSKDEQEILKQWEKAHRYLAKEIPHKYKQLIHKAKTFCEAHNIVYIDMNEEADFSENSKTLFFDVVHPNKQGHKIIAAIINKFLIAKFVL